MFGVIMARKPSIYDRGIDRIDSDMLLSKSKLLVRGWTPTAIGKFLGEPEQMSGSYKYYSLKRVLEIESSDVFKEWKQRIDEIREGREIFQDAENEFRKKEKETRDEARKRMVRKEIMGLRIEFPNASNYEDLCIEFNKQADTTGYIEPATIRLWLKKLALAQIHPIISKLKVDSEIEALIKSKVESSIKSRYSNVENLFVED